MMATNGRDKVLLSDDRQMVSVNPDGVTSTLFAWVEINGRELEDHEGCFIRLRMTPRGFTVVDDETGTPRSLVRCDDIEGERNEFNGLFELHVGDKIAGRLVLEGGTNTRMYGHVLDFHVPRS